MKTLWVLIFFCFINSVYAEPPPEAYVNALKKAAKKESPWCYKHVFVGCHYVRLEELNYDEKEMRITCDTFYIEQEVSDAQVISCGAHWNSIADRVLEDFKKSLIEQNKKSL